MATKWNEDDFCKNFGYDIDLSEGAGDFADWTPGDFAETLQNMYPDMSADEAKRRGQLAYWFIKDIPA